MDWLVLLVVVLYLAVILGIGIYSYGKIRDTSDYLVAGRQLSPLILAGTLVATSLGGGSTLGIVGNAYGKWGMSSVWYIIAIGIAFLILSFMAPALRKTSVRTIPEFFRIRYGKTSGFCCSCLTILSMISLTAAQMKASASIIEAMLGMDYNSALILASLVVAVYCLLGGFWGVALTDFLQGILIIVGMCAAIPYALSLAGGWQSVQLYVPADTLSFTKGIGGWPKILSYVILFFTSFAVGQEVVSSFYAAADGKAAKKGSLAAGVIVILFSVVPVILGVIMLALYNMNVLNQGVVEALEQNARYALPALAFSSMPSLVVGILYAGVLSATMSSADSALLGAGAVFSNDIYRIHINSEAEPRKLVAVTRLSMVFFMFLSFMTAIYMGNILTMLAFAMAVRAAGCFIPYFMGHIWKKPSQSGCLAAMIGGTGFYVWMENSLGWRTGVDAIIPALIISAILYAVFCTILSCRKENKTSAL